MICAGPPRRQGHGIGLCKHLVEYPTDIPLPVGGSQTALGQAFCKLHRALQRDDFVVLWLLTRP